MTVNESETNPELRTVTFFCVDATDYATPELGEAGGQPQVSVDGGRTWSDDGISTLGEGANGYYPATLTQALVYPAGRVVRTRYKSAATAEIPGETVQVASVVGLSAALAAALLGQIPINLNRAHTSQHIGVFRGEAWSSTNQGSERAIPFALQATEGWPTTLTTVHFYCSPTDETEDNTGGAAVGLSDVACTVTQATGSDRAFNLELTAAQTATLTANDNGTVGYTWVAVANKATYPAVIRGGTLTVRPNPHTP